MKRVAFIGLCLVAFASIGIIIRPPAASAQESRAAILAQRPACVADPSGNACLKERLDAIETSLDQLQSRPSSAAGSGPMIRQVVSQKTDNVPDIKYLQSEIDSLQKVVNQLVDRANQR